MRRFVRDRVAAALELARPVIEEYISRQLAYPLGFPGSFGAAMLIREVAENQQFETLGLALYSWASGPSRCSMGRSLFGRGGQPIGFFLALYVAKGFLSA